MPLNQTRAFLGHFEGCGRSHIQNTIHKATSRRQNSVCVCACCASACSKRPPRTAHRAGQLPAVQDEAALEEVMDHWDENSSRRELRRRASLGIPSLLTLQG